MFFEKKGRRGYSEKDKRYEEWVLIWWSVCQVMDISIPPLRWLKGPTKPASLNPARGWRADASADEMWANLNTCTQDSLLIQQT